MASTHGFLPNLLISIHLNAREVLGSTTPGCYFPHPVNASCHDITEAKSLPYSAKKVLGLGGKFIVTPSYTTAKCLMLDKLERLGRDVALKVHFAGEEGLDMDGSKLFVKSSWMPPNPPLQVVYSRLETFDSKLCSLFIKRKVNSNLSKFQKGLYLTPFATMTITSLPQLTRPLVL